MSAFGVASLLFAFNAGSAHGGDLLGGVAGAVGGAIGGVAGALGGGGGGGGNAAPGNAPDAAGGAGAGSGAMGVSAGSQSAKASAIGPNKKLKRVVMGEDAERCGNTLFDFLRGHNCDDWRTARAEADGDEFDQASTSPADDPLMRKPEAAKKAVKLQPPVRKKATAPKQTARLNIEKPAVEKPRLTIAPKLIKPDAVEKAQPKAEPALSCAKAGTIVGDYGFSAISPADCEGRVYAFDASRDGKSFTVRLNAMNGELIEVRKLP